MEANVKRKILIVDDNEAKLYTLTRFLIQAGYEVSNARTGAESLKKLAENPDLVLLDVNLPDMTGFEVCHQIKSLYAPRFIPVLHISATYTESQHQAYGLETGADGYLIEPIDRRVLSATIKALLRLKDAETSLKYLAQEFYLLAEGSPDMICRFVFQPQPHFSYVNSASTAILGYTPDEHYNDPELRLKIIHPEDRQLFLDLMQSKIQTTQTFLARYYHKNGNLIYLESHVKPVLDEKGETTALISISRDVTARLQREQAIQQLLAAEKPMSSQAQQTLIPICAGCKKVRINENQWVEVEEFFGKKYAAAFTHGLCPDCMAYFYPDYAPKKKG